MPNYWSLNLFPKVKVMDEEVAGQLCTGHMTSLTPLSQLATARMSALGEKAILEIESGGG